MNAKIQRLFGACSLSVDMQPGLQSCNEYRALQVPAIAEKSGSATSLKKKTGPQKCYSSTILSSKMACKFYVKCAKVGMAAMVCRLTLSLLRSAIQCFRGARSSAGHLGTPRSS